VFIYKKDDVAYRFNGKHFYKFLCLILADRTAVCCAQYKCRPVTCVDSFSQSNVRIQLPRTLDDKQLIDILSETLTLHK